jgi:hypothetical protein
MAIGYPGEVRRCDIIADHVTNFCFSWLVFGCGIYSLALRLNSVL